MLILVSFKAEIYPIYLPLYTYLIFSKMGPSIVSFPRIFNNIWKLTFCTSSINFVPHQNRYSDSRIYVLSATGQRLVTIRSSRSKMITFSNSDCCKTGSGGYTHLLRKCDHSEWLVTVVINSFPKTSGTNSMNTNYWVDLRVWNYVRSSTELVPPKKIENVLNQVYASVRHCKKKRVNADKFW